MKKEESMWEFWAGHSDGVRRPTGVVQVQHGLAINNSGALQNG